MKLKSFVLWHGQETQKYRQASQRIKMITNIYKICYGRDNRKVEALIKAFKPILNG